MTEAASQPIPAKPALSLITRSGLLLAATPSILWLLLYFALAAHLRLGLGRWPDSIGDNPDTPLFQMHTELVWMYFTALLFSLFAGKQGEEQGGEVHPDQLGVHLEEGCVGVVADGVGPAAKTKPEVGGEGEVE